MKKNLLLTAAAMSMLLMFSSCQNSTVSENVTQSENINVAPSDIIEKVVALYDSSTLPESIQFEKNVSEDDDKYLEPDMAGTYFYDEYAKEIPILSKLEDYCLYMPNSKRVFEVDILKVADKADIDEAKELLEARLALKNNGDVHTYAPDEVPYLEAAEIYNIGNYVILLATTDNSLARPVIEEMLSAPQSSEENTSENTDTDNSVVESSAETINKEDVKEFESIINVDITESADNTQSESENVSPETEKTEPPVISVVSHNDNTKLFICGTCTEGSVIHMRGGVSDLTYTSDDGHFMGNVELNSDGINTIYVTAEEDGKAESEPYIIDALARTDVTVPQTAGTYNVIVGDNYQCFVQDEVEDFTGANIFSESQIESIQKNVEDKVKFLQSGGRNAELIYLIAPIPMNIYPENVPDEYKQATGITRAQQFEKLATDAGATVINLTDVFMEHKNDEYKLYHKTDTHWTHYGAYLGYRELMNHIGEKFEDAKPRPIEDFEFYKERVMGGDMPINLGISPEYMIENCTFARYNFESKYDINIYFEGTNRLDNALMQNPIITKNEDSSKNLPRAYIFRDSYGTNPFVMISDRFSEISWQGMWGYNFDKGSIADFNPDYVIYIITERDIRDILG